MYQERNKLDLIWFRVDRVSFIYLLAYDKLGVIFFSLQIYKSTHHDFYQSRSEPLAYYYRSITLRCGSCCTFSAVLIFSRFSTHWGRDKMTEILQMHIQMHSLAANICILIDIPLKFNPKGPVDKIQPLVQIMMWCWPGNKPLSEPMFQSLLMHLCGSWPQWVNKVSCQ